MQAKSEVKQKIMGLSIKRIQEKTFLKNKKVKCHNSSQSQKEKKFNMNIHNFVQYR